MNCELYFLIGSKKKLKKKRLNPCAVRVFLIFKFFVMKKNFVLGLVTLFFSICFTNSEAYAGGCSISCTFSSCEVGGCDLYGCGCYFGIAFCKCEESQKKPTFQKATHRIDDYAAFAINSGLPGLIGIANILRVINPENFDAEIVAYKAQIEQLTNEEKNLFIAYLGDEY